MVINNLFLNLFDFIFKIIYYNRLKRRKYLSNYSAPVLHTILVAAASNLQFFSPAISLSTAVIYCHVSFFYWLLTTIYYTLIKLHNNVETSTGVDWTHIFLPDCSTQYIINTVSFAATFPGSAHHL